MTYVPVFGMVVSASVGFLSAASVAMLLLAVSGEVVAVVMLLFAVSAGPVAVAILVFVVSAGFVAVVIDCAAVGVVGDGVTFSVNSAGKERSKDCIHRFYGIRHRLGLPTHAANVYSKVYYYLP